MLDIDTAMQRVSAGVKVMDADDPRWFAPIELDRLDIGSAFDCVLGQTGGYSERLAALAGIPEDIDKDAWQDRFAVEHGFCSSDDGDTCAEDALLSDLWASVIRIRQAA